MKILKLLALIFKPFRKKDNNTEIAGSSMEDEVVIPSETVSLTSAIPSNFELKEKISRSVFSPMNVNEKTKKLKNNAFTTPAGLDEVSVNRLSHSTPDFIKKISKIIAKPQSGRGYFGVAIIDVEQIYECNSDIVYTPTSIPHEGSEIDNPFHSDIQIGYVKEIGKALPAEYNYKVEMMVEKARLYQDNDPDAESWTGCELI